MEGLVVMEATLAADVAELVAEHEREKVRTHLSLIFPPVSLSRPHLSTLTLCAAMPSVHCCSRHEAALLNRV